MDNIEVKRIPVNDMEAVYIIHESGQVSFTIIPAGNEELYFDKIHPDPMVQVSCTGDASSLGFAAGETRHNSAMTGSMKYESQDIEETDEETVITTTLVSPEGIKAGHIVSAKKDSRALRIYTLLQNHSAADITIEALSSVNLCAITPYTEDEGRGRLVLHRFRSRWSAEGRHE
jgi:alpha-galactosidase